MKVQQKQMEAAALLGAASAKTTSDTKENTGSEKQNARQIADVVGQILKPKIVRKLSEASILWVDDIPSNNYYERSALETLGLSFTVSLTTEDALEKIRLRKFDVIISDMGRPGDPQAGYTLLEEVRKLGDNSPFIIYSSSNNPKNKELARSKGAFGATGDPQELFQLVLSTLSSE